MAVFNRRNAILGWSYWRSRRLKRRIKRASRSGEGRSRSLLAVGLAGLAGALVFRRSRRRQSGEDS